MELATITMDPELAREKLRAYRAQVHRDAEGEYEAAVAGYRALAEGTPLIDLDQAIIAGGRRADGRPRLAVARADQRVVHIETARSWREPGIAFWFRCGAYQARRSPSLNIAIRAHEGPGFQPGFSLVPMIPADVRPHTGQPREWHILWEVEQWHDRHPIIPPGDPYLLKHIHGRLWAILSQWDLTPLERAIMADRATR